MSLSIPTRHILPPPPLPSCLMMSLGSNHSDRKTLVDEELIEESLIAEEEDDQWLTGSTGQELYEHYRVVTDPGQQLLRIDRFLVDRMPHTSRHRIQLAARA